MAPSSMKKRGTKRVVVFSSEARIAHLRGFSERKKQRRVYGLAMQKVKDRTAKLVQRKEEKQDQLERIEQAERHKEMVLEDFVESRAGIAGGTRDVESDSDNETEDAKATSTIKTYNDKKTETQWGGRVTVMTSEIEMGGDSDDDDVPQTKQKSFDLRQRYAGKVERFMKDLNKGNMPGKKRDQNHKRKGIHGAAEKVGTGNLKIAQKALASTNQAKPKKSWEKGKKGKGKGKGGKR
jgi:hypothetical protein